MDGSQLSGNTSVCKQKIPDSVPGFLLIVSEENDLCLSGVFLDKIVDCTECGRWGQGGEKEV